jgi:multicomponent Na+:H+ antiporter subunit E
MRSLLLNLILAITWAAITGDFSAFNLTLGFVLGFIILLFADRATDQRQYLTLFIRVLDFAVFFVVDFVLANIRMAYAVLFPSRTIRPGIVAIPLDAKTDLEIMLVANLISLTPGTFSIDVSTDRRTLYIHEMYIDDVEMLRHDVKRHYEFRLLRVLR